MLYKKMTYMVRQVGQNSDAFKSLLGVLIGDPASPTFWNLFLADFALDLDVDDASLMGLIISHLGHADDMAIVSHTLKVYRDTSHSCFTGAVLICLLLMLLNLSL